MSNILLPERKKCICQNGCVNKNKQDIILFSFSSPVAAGGLEQYPQGHVATCIVQPDFNRQTHLFITN